MVLVRPMDQYAIYPRAQDRLGPWRTPHVANLGLLAILRRPPDVAGEASLVSPCPERYLINVYTCISRIRS